MLQLPADLCFLDELPDQLGLVLVALEQDFDRQVVPQVGIVPLSTAPIPPRAISSKIS